jgi:hypothetical protein
LEVFMPKPTQLFSILLGTSLLVSACAGVTRLPARAKGPAGESLQEKKPDLAVLDAPGSRREDVLRSFASIDTGYQNPRLFWARWSDSKWGYWWVIAGGNSAAGDAGRLWHVHNLLVSFAEDGSIRSKKMFDDSPSLWVELHAQLTGAPSLELAEPVHLAVLGSGGVSSITLTKGKVLLERHKKKNPTLEASPLEIVRFSHSRYSRKLFPGATCHTLHFAAATSWGKSVLVCASPSDVATLFQYLQQEGAPLLRWD